MIQPYRPALAIAWLMAAILSIGFLGWWAIAPAKPAPPTRPKHPTILI